MLFKPWLVHDKAGWEGKYKCIHMYTNIFQLQKKTCLSRFHRISNFERLCCTLFASPFRVTTAPASAVSVSVSMRTKSACKTSRSSNLIQTITTPQNHYENSENILKIWNMSWYDVPPKERWRHRCPCHYNWNHQRSQELLPPAKQPKLHPKWLAKRLWLGVSRQQMILFLDMTWSDVWKI